MQVKLFELRDKGTFIPVFAFRCKPDAHGEQYEEQRYLLRRAGYNMEDGLVILGSLSSPKQCAFDPYEWPAGTRTFQIAHAWLQQHFDLMKDGDVICVETILGERDTPKISERLGG